MREHQQVHLRQRAIFRWRLPQQGELSTSFCSQHTGQRQRHETESKVRTAHASNHGDLHAAAVTNRRPVGTDSTHTTASTDEAQLTADRTAVLGGLAALLQERKHIGQGLCFVSWYVGSWRQRYHHSIFTLIRYDVHALRRQEDYYIASHDPDALVVIHALRRGGGVQLSCL